MSPFPFQQQENGLTLSDLWRHRQATHRINGGGFDLCSHIPALASQYVYTFTSAYTHLRTISRSLPFGLCFHTPALAPLHVHTREYTHLRTLTTQAHTHLNYPTHRCGGMRVPARLPTTCAAVTACVPWRRTWTCLLKLCLRW